MQENLVLEVTGGGELAGAVLHITRPGKPLDLTYIVGECIEQIEDTRVYTLTLETR